MWTDRTTLLYGEEKMGRLREAHVLIVGVGGVGAYAAEMLVRAGVGTLTMMDADTVNPTNINRQLCALHSTVACLKVDVLAERFKDINPSLKIHSYAEFLEADKVTTLLDDVRPDFIIDAIDTIAPKCALIMEALRRRIPIVCSMGAGAKTDVAQIRFADLWSTYHCGLSKAVRNRLKAEGMKGRPVPVVFSEQQADMNAILVVEGERNKKSTTGTVSYMPAVFGCYLAQYVLERL
ncbi:MAG: tRNA threonylcarbamoyladenosine dehydratase [Paraprevotella sp.]|nr:tRNA threonylcarbamoyladenosine dehydratase [Paraprevotella sp.]